MAIWSRKCNHSVRTYMLHCDYIQVSGLQTWDQNCGFTKGA